MFKREIPANRTNIMLIKNLVRKYQLLSLLTFAAGVTLIGVSGVFIFSRQPLGFFILIFGIFFFVIGGLPLLFYSRGVKLRTYHVILNIVGLLLILFSMFLFQCDYSDTWIPVWIGMLLLTIGCFPSAYKLPSYIALAFGVTLLIAACIASVYISYRQHMPSDFETEILESHDGVTYYEMNIHPFWSVKKLELLKFLILSTLGVYGFVLILASVASLFRLLLFKKRIKHER